MKANQNFSESELETKEFHTLSSLSNIGHSEIVTGCEHMTSSRNTELVDLSVLSQSECLSKGFNIIPMQPYVTLGIQK